MSIKDYNTKDTIAAIATFPEKSALGVIRISGSRALAIASMVFVPAKKKDIRKVPSYTVHYGWIADKGTGPKAEKKELIDEVLVTVMRAPSTYTREDVVEISSHGGIVVLSRIMDLVIKKGVRPAFPGEFTYRAFVNGRVDLLQAQAVLDIVQAQSDDGLQVALRQVKGEVSKKIDRLRSMIKGLFEPLEAAMQFPDDVTEIPGKKLERGLSLVDKELDKIILAAAESDLLRKGLRCVLCGRANSGKSTLFNLLLKEERVIVTRIAGTTRDVIEETIQVKGVPIKIYDTAGILEPKDLIEEKALEKSYQKIDEADIILLLLDNSRTLGRDDRFLLEKVRDKNTVIVVNKIDLASRLDPEQIKGYKLPVIRISALKNKRLGLLEQVISRRIYRSGVARDDLLFLSLWQKNILKKIKDQTMLAGQYLKNGHSSDLVALSLKEMLDDLGRFSGEVTSQEILDDIFSKFCIGK